MLWALKIAGKLVLSRLPVPYGLWSRVGIFRHGAMAQAEYSLNVFKSHAANAFPKGLPQDFTMLELGPGDSLASAVIGAAHGASRIWLVDAGAYAHAPLSLYKGLASRLAAQGLTPPDVSAAQSVRDVLQLCRAEYLTGGLESLRGLPDACVDFQYSQAVLEHIRKKDFTATMVELRRVLKPGGRASHVIDFQDHLAHALNNMRFSEKLWEKDWFGARSGFYTNRIPAPHMLKLFKAAGYKDAAVLNTLRWDALPTPRAALHDDFSAVPDDALLTYGITVRMEAA